jgi:thiol-disulfide isomerase/thioredoxin
MRSLWLLFVALLSLGGIGLRAADETHPALKLGSAAPPFDLPGVDGKRHRLEDFREATVLVVVFTCNHCPTAQLYEDRLKELVRDYTGKPVAVVAISPNSPKAVRPDELGYTDLGDDLEDMKVRAAYRKFNFPYLYDGETQTASKLYGPQATPQVFIFDRDRRLRYAGRIDDSERPEFVKVRDARAAIDALLAGQTPAVGETKVFGCSTKWDHKSDGNAKWLAKVHAEPVKLEMAGADALRELRGKTASGRVRLVNFWATWCGPCVAEFPDLVNLNLMYRGRDFEFVTVAAQFPDERDRVQRFLERQHASGRNLLFGETDKYRMIEACDPEWNGALPHTLLIAPDGKILFRHTGDLDLLDLKRRIVAALDQVQPWGGGK